MRLHAFLLSFRALVLLACVRLLTIVGFTREVVVVVICPAVRGLTVTLFWPSIRSLWPLVRWLLVLLAIETFGLVALVAVA